MCGMKISAGAWLAVVAGFGASASMAFAQSQPEDTSGAADAPAATAPSVAPAPVPPAYFGSVALAKGKGKLVKLPRAVANLFVADDSIASVRPASPGVMFVFGKTPGTTDVVATDQDGNRIAQYSITVNPSDYQGSRLQEQSQAVAPGNGVTAESEPGGMVVRGTVNTPEEADNVINQAKAISGSTVINDLTVNEPIQVQLKVRIASMDAQHYTPVGHQLEFSRRGRHYDWPVRAAYFVSFRRSQSGFSPSWRRWGYLSRRHV